MSYFGDELDHRWGERVRVNIPVRVHATSSSEANGCMKNLSLSGALMKSDCDLALHSLIELSIAMPAPSPHTALIRAQVSRKIKEGFGIEWHEFAPNIIKELVRSAAI
ncbi:MAG TPA: PilZ domain-containing protein [Steroidobacteraceae bacterium]|nr:PilZ domain-containing protein [Steroidobacteraceae bacterium]